MQRNTVFPMLAGLALGLIGCSQEPPKPTAAAAAPAQESPFRLTATIQDIMDAEVDPAADFLWASVGFVATKKGVEDKTPHTDAQWATVRHNALILIEATNLLVMNGRQVALEGKTLDEEEKAGIEDPKEIQTAIEANRAAFINFAHALHDVGADMLQAIDKRDVAAMDALGEKLDGVCEQCHRTFWYPKAVEPIQTLEPPKP